MPITALEDIADCKLALDARSDVFSDAGTTPAVVGDLVQQWGDQSAEANHATQATEGNRPTYNTLGGVGALRFLSNDKMDTPSLFGAGYDTAYTYVCVYMPEYPDFKAINGCVGTTGWYHAMNTDAAANVEKYQLNSPAGDFNFTVADVSHMVAVYRYNGTNQRVRVAGPDADFTHTAAGTGNLGLTGALKIGAHGGGSFEFHGYLRAVGVYSRSLSDAEVDDIVAWALAEFMTWPAGSRSTGAGDKIVVCDGNSLTAGQGDGGGASSYPSQLDTLLGAGWTVTNKGASGAKTGYMLTDRSRTLNEIDALWSADAAKNIVVYFEGTNEFSAGATGASAVNSFQRHKEYGLLRKYKGWQTIVCTVPKWGTATANHETERQALNTLLLANYADFADAVVDLAADPAFSDPEDLTYYDADTLHWTAAANAVVADLVRDAIEALPSVARPQRLVIRTAAGRLLIQTAG